MQNGFFKTYGKVILFAFLGISIVAAVIGQNKQNNTLAVYTSTDVVQQETLSDSSSEEDNIETQIYADNTYHFSISIPKDWTQVIDHDTVSYIHKPSGATIRMEVFAYNPAINNVAADTLSASITQDGKTFKNFTRIVFFSASETICSLLSGIITDQVSLVISLYTGSPEVTFRSF